MIQLPSPTMEWRDRGKRAANAAVVILCYLIVLAGILYSMAGGPH